MKAGKGWDTEMIKTQLEETIKEEGRKPEYVVSDNGLIMCKAASELELKHHRDISHSFGIFLENVYSKDPEFCDFIAKKGYARKFSHTPMACLMPPKRREYARFMNVFETVHWAKAVIDNEHLLSSKEKYMLSFVKTHASIPLRLRLSTIEDCKSFNARTAIGKTKMKDIKKWRADNLLPNPSIKRMNVLKKVS